MRDWILGFIAECCWRIARFHEWRASRYEARMRKRIGGVLTDVEMAQRANAAADRWSKRQQRADRVQLLSLTGPTGPKVSY